MPNTRNTGAERVLLVNRIEVSRHTIPFDICCRATFADNMNGTDTVR